MSLLNESPWFYPRGTQVEMAVRVRACASFFLCSLLASAQNFSLPGNLSVRAVTPDAAFVQHIFSTEAKNELPDQASLTGTTSKTWERQLNSSTTAPYLLCADAGRAGVLPVLEYFPKPTTLPFYAKENLTCYIIQTRASDVQNITLTHSMVKYVTPLPAVLKLAKGFFRQVHTGYYLGKWVNKKYN